MDRYNAEVQQKKEANEAIHATDQGCSSAAIEKYWLNESESQQDTARQIMSISILLLGVSITLITNNIDNIDFLLGQMHAQINSGMRNELLSNAIFYIMCALTVIFFFIYVVIWIMAIIKSRESLRIELIEDKTLAEIAKIKQEHCESATKIIILGTSITATLTVLFLIIILNYQIEESIAIAVAILVCAFIFKPSFRHH